MTRSNELRLPQNQDAEQAVLGAMLTEGSLINQVIEFLIPEDFYETRNQVLYRCLTQMHNQNISIDIATVHEELKSKGLLGQVGDFLYLSQLTQLVASTANVMYFAEKVKKTARERRLCETLMDLIYRLGEGQVAFDHAAEQLRTAVEKEETSSYSCLKPISAKDLPDTHQVDSLWGEFFYPECIIQINSEPGIGKTTLLYNICAYGAMGKPFLDIPFSKPIKTLYVDLETPQWLRRQKLERIVKVKNLPENLFFQYALDLKTDYLELLTLCKKERYDLVVFDTQSRVLAMEKENDNSEANYMLNLMRRITNETKCALSLIHHSGKTENSKGVYKGRGASAIAGGVDIVINLEALDEDTIKLTVGKNRISGTNPVLYLRKAGEDIFEPYTPPGGNSGFEIFKAQDFILSLDDREWHTDEIYGLGETRGFSESTLKRALSKLVEVGKWARIKKGLYRRPRTGQGSESSGYIPDPNDPNSSEPNFPDCSDNEADPWDLEGIEP